MARRRINSDEAIEIFEDGWTKFEPRLTSPFLIELDVREIFGGQGRRQGQMDIPEFIDGWMSWRALRSVGYVVRDASKALQAACHARGALLYGCLGTAGRGKDRRFWIPTRDRIYEEHNNGRLMLPIPAKGARRQLVLEQHADVSRPVIQGILRAICEHPACPDRIPPVWMRSGCIPESLRDRTIQEAFDIIVSGHECMPVIQGHIMWMVLLRDTLLSLGDPVLEAVPLDNDEAILVSLAP
jgi:hypothetical protein